MSIQPYLSIVVTARNDNHGGNMLHRMQVFLNGLFAQTAKYRVNSELIVVEWNPPSDKRRLAQELSWPDEHSSCTVRFIEVPASIHQRYRHCDRIYLYQMIAKNVGIRRARGQFILLTNIDILIHDKLFAFLASNNLSDGKLYRVNRYDVAENIPANASIDDQLLFCEQNVIQINMKYGTFNLITGNYHMIFPLYAENNYDYLKTSRPCLHTNACGDFQLMAFEHWHALCGYPEFDLHALHVDSLLEFNAHFAGIREESLPDAMRIYHIEHLSDWKNFEKSRNLYDDKLKSSNIPKLTDSMFNIYRGIMKAENRSIIFNDSNWGLMRDEFNESIIVKATYEDKGKISMRNETISIPCKNGLQFAIQPLVSIISISLNGMPYIKNCIESILFQDYPNVEYIIQDGGSTDGTVELLKTYGNRIKWNSIPDAGNDELMNQALQRCRGDIVGICNTDDEFFAHAASWAIENFKIHADFGAIYGDYYEVDEQGKIIRGPMLGPLSFNFERMLCSEDVIPMQSAFFRRSALCKAGLLKNPWLPKICEDFAIWLYLGIVAQITRMPGAISNYRLHSGRATFQAETYHKSYIVKREVLERFFVQDDVPPHLKSLRHRALGKLSLSVAEMFLSHFKNLFTAMKYVQIARNDQPDISHLNELKQTIESWNTSIDFFYQHGASLFSLGKYEEALAIFDSITALDCWIPGLQYSKAICLLQLNRMKDAVTSLQKELSLNPRHEHASRLLREIYV